MADIPEDPTGGGGGVGGEEKTEKERQTSPRPSSGAKPLYVPEVVETIAKEKKKKKKTSKPRAQPHVEVKATTGDCDTDESWNGRTVLNTVDNTFKIFAAGAWQTVASGW